MGENYLVLNGKRIELTKEQIEILIGKEKENPFARKESGEEYYWISSITGVIAGDIEENNPSDNYAFNTANYCADKELLLKRAKEETLNRLLWRFTYENGWSDELWNDGNIQKYYIEKEVIPDNEYFVGVDFIVQGTGIVYFVSKEIAQRAIDEIIIPFEKGELPCCKVWEEKDDE